MGRNPFEGTVLYMMYVVPVGFVSRECNDPEMKPITHEKVWEGKCTGSGSVGLSKTWCGLHWNGMDLEMFCRLNRGF